MFIPAIVPVEVSCALAQFLAILELGVAVSYVTVYFTKEPHLGTVSDRASAQYIQPGSAPDHGREEDGRCSTPFAHLTDQRCTRLLEPTRGHGMLPRF